MDNGTVTVTVTAAPTVLAPPVMTGGGMAVRFDRSFDATQLNLFPVGGQPADLTLSGPGGPVRGSLVPDQDGKGFTFVPAGGPLPAGDYVLTLRSAADGFADGGGLALDGDGDGVPGGDYVYPFTAAAGPGTMVAMAGFARAPGQPVSVPAGGAGLPVRVTPGNAAVTDLALAIHFDPALLAVTGAAAGPQASAGSIVTFELIAPGVARLTYHGSVTLTGGATLDLIALTAAVTADAPMGAKAVLRVAGVAVNGGAVAATATPGVQAVAVFGDTNGSGTFSGLDAVLVARLAAGLSSGLSAYPLVDPLLVADTNGNGGLSGLDAVLIARKVAGLPVAQIPDAPGTPVAAGPDPVVAVGTVAAARGEAAEVPVTMAVPAAEATGAVVQGVIVAPGYDTAAVRVTGVRLSDELAATGFTAQVWIDAGVGTVLVSAFTGEDGIRIPVGGRTIAFVLEVEVLPSAAAGPAALNLLPQGGALHTGTENEFGPLPNTAPPTAGAGDAVDGEVIVATGPTADLLRVDDIDPLPTLGGVFVG